MPTIDELKVKLEADISGLKAGLSQGAAQIQSFEKSANTATSSVASGFRRLAPAAAAAAAALATAFGGRAIFNAGVQVESLNGKMLAAVGNADAAAQSLQWLREECERLGLRFVGTADSFASFAASATRAGLTLQQSRDIFLGVSEAAVALRLSNERTQLVFQALSQIAAKGVVSMEELRQQLGESLPIAMEAAARGMGVTQAKLIEMVSKGEVMSKDFLPAFGRAIRENLGDAVDTASKSAQAGMNRLNNAVDNLKATAANGEFLDKVTEATERLTEVINDPEVQEGLKNFASLLGDIAIFAAKAAAAVGNFFSTAETRKDAIRAGITGTKEIEEYVRQQKVLKAAAENLDWSKLGLGGVEGSGGLLQQPTGIVEAGSYNAEAGGSGGSRDTGKKHQFMLEQLRNQLSGVQYDLASPTEKLQKDLEEQQKVLKEGLQNKLLTEQEYRELTLAAEEEHAAKLGEIRQQEADKEAQRQRQLEDMKKSLRESGYNAAMGILQMLAGKNKAAALAMIAIEKARAIAAVLIAGQEAGMKAAAAAAPLGPAAAAAAYSSMVSLSQVSAGLIAAQGLAQAAMTLGGGGSSGSSGSSYTNDYNTGAVVSQTTATPRQINITLMGDSSEFFSKSTVRKLIEELNDAMVDGSVLRVNGAPA